MPKIFKLFFQNKKTLILIMGLVLSLVPSSFAYAYVWDDILAAILGLPMYLVSLPIRIPFFFAALILGLVGLITGVMFSFIISLLNWLKTIILTVPITHGGVVDVGWTFTRDFANMFFILILVYIGLATILRLRDYEAKKTLPKLLFVALLINFTPIIVGFVVDTANIFTNFFLNKAGGFSSATTILTNAFTYITSSFGTIFTIDGQFLLPSRFPAILGVLIGILVYGLILIVFYGFASLIYLLVIVLLLARIVFLWILMILAPIAFFSQVLPPSKTVKALFPSVLHWDEWWEKLIQWSILGIPLGFFLYLSNWIMLNQSVINTMFSGSMGVGGVPSSVNLADSANAFTSMLTPLIAMSLLGFGTMISIQAAPAGAKQIMDFAKKGGMTAGKWAGGKGLAAAREKVPESWRTRMESMSASKNPKWGEGRKGILGYAMRGTAGISGFAQRGIGGLATKTVVGGEKDAASKSETEAKERDVMGNLGALRQAQTKAERLGIIKAMIGKKQMRDALSEDVVGKNVLTTEETFDAYKKAGQFKDRDATEDMEFSFIHMKGMADKMAGFVDNETAGAIKEEDRTGKQYGRPSGLTEDDIKKGYTSYKDKVIRSAKTTDDMKKFNKSLWKQDDAVESALYFERNQIAAATTQFSRTFSDPLQAAAEAKGKDWFYKINPVTGKMNAPYLPKYFASTAAQGSYMPLDGAETISAIKPIEQKARKKQKSYLESELATATGTRASDIRREIGLIETEEKREREKMAAPEVEEKIPLTVQMKSAGGEKKKILQRAFDRRPVHIQKEENGISGLDDVIAQNEKAAREASEEVSRMLRIEGLKETDRPVKDKRDEIESLASQLKTMRDDRDIRMKAWHNMMDAWRSQSPESFIAQDIIKLREEEKVANEALVKMKTLGKSKDVIERAGKDLERIKDVKHGRESELALHLRSKAANLPTAEKNMITNILNNGPQTPTEKVYYEDLRKGTIAFEAAVMKSILAEPIIKKGVKPVVKIIKKVGAGAAMIGRKGAEKGTKAKEGVEKLVGKVTPERTKRKKEIKKIIEEEKESS